MSHTLPHLKSACVAGSCCLPGVHHDIVCACCCQAAHLQPVDDRGQALLAICISHRGQVAAPHIMSTLQQQQIAGSSSSSSSSSKSMSAMTAGTYMFSTEWGLISSRSTWCISVWWAL